MTPDFDDEISLDDEAASFMPKPRFQTSPKSAPLPSPALEDEDEDFEIGVNTELDASKSPFGPKAKVGGLEADTGASAGAVSIAKPLAKPLLPPPSEDSLVWGAIGVNTWERLSQKGRKGIVRYVEAGVTYRTPPLRDLAYWKESSQAYQRYEMEMEDDPRANSQTFEAFVADLRLNKPSQADDPRLITLEAIADSLLDYAIRLRSKNWGLGLLSPRGIMLWRTKSHKISLPDLGFYWEKSLDVPPWLDDEGQYAKLWTEPTKSKTTTSGAAQRKSPAQLQLRGFPEGHDRSARFDIQVLGRLLTWTVNEFDEVLDHVPKHRPRFKGHVGDVLDNAVEGRFERIEDFANALKESPLRLAWFPPQPPKPPVPWARYILIIGLLAALLGTGVWFRNDIMSFLQPSKTVKEPVNPPDPGLTQKKEEGNLKPNPMPTPETPLPAPSAFLADWGRRYDDQLARWDREPSNPEPRKQAVNLYRELAKHIGDAGSSATDQERKAMESVRQSLSSKLHIKPEELD